MVDGMASVFILLGTLRNYSAICIQKHITNQRTLSERDQNDGQGAAHQRARGGEQGQPTSLRFLWPVLARHSWLFL